MTFDIGLHEVCVRVGVRYVITKFSRMDSLPNFLTYGAPLRTRVHRHQLRPTVVGLPTIERVHVSRSVFTFSFLRIFPSFLVYFRV